MTEIKNIVIFCGSSLGRDPSYKALCKELVKLMFDRGIGLVYGGGNIGLMGVLADEMLRLGGEVTGVIPQKLVDIEVAHTGLTHLHIVSSMHERKALMASLSQAFIALPGGLGTLEEFFEVFTWFQLNYHNKPVCLLNWNGFYDLLLKFLEQIVNKGFIARNQLDNLLVGQNPGEIFRLIMGN
jgi:uncharacterized protein (TIGR00730 family)